MKIEFLEITLNYPQLRMTTNKSFNEGKYERVLLKFFTLDINTGKPVYKPNLQIVISSSDYSPEDFMAWVNVMEIAVLIAKREVPAILHSDQHRAIMDVFKRVDKIKKEFGLQ